MSDDMDTGDNAVQTDVTETTTETEEPQNTNEWFLTDGVPGQGEKPEYFKDDKYKTLAEQAKGYKELESKFGAFTGAPSEYKIPDLPDEIKDSGFEVDAENPIIERAMEFAKAAGMNQEGFDEMFKLYAESQIAEYKAIEEIRAQELKSLGNQGEARLNNLNKWANANLSPELLENFQNLATSAKAVETLEHLVSLTRSAPLNPDNATAAPAITAEEVRELHFAKDEFGQPKMRDPEYHKMVMQKYDQLYGTENHIEIIGN
jgi:hypothetical protein